MDSNVINVTVDAADLKKLAISLWFSGCSLKCGGCHNVPLCDTLKGMPINVILSKLRSHRLLCDWAIFTGGHPIENPELLEYLLTECKALGYKTLVYTGLPLGEFLERFEGDYTSIDLLKTGAYVESLKQASYYYASTNQKLYGLHGKEINLIYEWDDLEGKEVINTEETTRIGITFLGGTYGN
jgi:hypothetical protein